MILTKKSSCSVVLVLTLLLVCVFPFHVHAAVTDSLILPEADGDSVIWYDNGATVDMYISTDGSSAQERTFTFTSKASGKILVSFEFSFSKEYDAGAYSFSENVATTSGNTGSVTLNPGEFFTATITLPAETSDGNLVLSGITITEVKETIITVKYNNLGSVANYPNGTQVIVPDSGLSLTATAGSDAKFLGWTDQNGKLLGDAATITVSGTADLTEVHACFATTSPWFLVKATDGTYLVEGLNPAVAKVPSGTEATIVLMNDATLPSGDYSIPANATLLIPFNDAHTPCIGAPERSKEEYYNTTNNIDNRPKVYRTLKMASGAKISVSGHLSVAGTQSAVMGTNSCPMGYLGMIEMAGNSSITVESGGNLYVWGYIYRKAAGDEGTITIKNGSTVYECFQIMDWRGGQGTTNMTTVNKGKRVFPISQYYIQNVQVPMTIQSGATEKIAVAFEASGSLVTNMVSFIGNTDGMFRMGSGGSVTKDYEEETDRLNISVTDTITMADIELSMYGYDLKSSDYILPVNGNISITLEPNCNVSQTQDISLLPGAEIRINEQASLTVESGAELIVFDASEWGNYCGASNVRYVPVAHAHPDKVGRSNLSEDAKVVVEGTLNATSGYLITTSSGASVIGTNNHIGTVNMKSAGSYNLYGPTQGSYTILGKTIYYVDFDNISVNSAKLHNTGSSYVTVNSTSAAVTYTYAHDKWIQGQHTVSVSYAWNDKTCKASASCNCGFTDSETVTAAEVADTRVEPNCTETGSADFKADFTKSWATDQTKNFTLPTNDSHSFTNYVSDDNATCTADGTETAKCDRCTVTDTRTDEGSAGHDMVAGNVVAPTCSATGYTIYDCSRCDHTETRDETEINPDAHKYGDWTVVTPATCSTDGSKIRVCSLNKEHTETVTIDKLATNGTHLWFGENDAFDGTCQRENCPDVLIRYDGILLSIEGEIQLRLKFVIHPDLKDNTAFSNAQVYVTEEGNAIERDKAWHKALSAVKNVEASDFNKYEDYFYYEDDGRYVISQGIAAGEMTGDVTVQFKLSEGDDATVIPFYHKDTKAMAEILTKRVTDFAQVVHDATQKPGFKAETSTYDELWQMCRWAVTFGGHAQDFYGTHTGKYANAILDDRGGVPASTATSTDNGNIPLESYKTTTKRNGSYGGPAVQGQRLNLDSRIYMRTYFKVPEGMTVEDFENGNERFTVELTSPSRNGTQQVTASIEWTVEERNNNKRLCLDILDIPPAYWNDTFTIVITDTTTSGTYTIQTSALAWCNSCVKTENKSTKQLEAQYNMALAMYDYAKAADAYYTVKNGN